MYVSQLIRFARSCSKVEEFNIRNLSITSNGFNSGLMAGQGKLVVALFRRNVVTAHEWRGSVLSSFHTGRVTSGGMPNWAQPLDAASPGCSYRLW